MNVVNLTPQGVEIELEEGREGLGIEYQVNGQRLSRVDFEAIARATGGVGFKTEEDAKRTYWADFKKGQKAMRYENGKEPEAVVIQDGEEGYKPTVKVNSIKIVRDVEEMGRRIKAVNESFGVVFERDDE